jgi:hypothetical protein
MAGNSVNTNPNDSTTQLNPAASNTGTATAGDVMDESLVNQISGTQAKRERVVLGGDANTGGSDLVQPVRARDAQQGYQLPVADPTMAEVVKLLIDIRSELSELNGHIRQIATSDLKQSSSTESAKHFVKGISYRTRQSLTTTGKEG